MTEPLQRPIDVSVVSESDQSTDETSKDTNGESLETNLTSIEEVVTQDLSQDLSSPPEPSSGSQGEGGEGEEGEEAHKSPLPDVEVTPVHATEVPKPPSPVEAHAPVNSQPLFYPQSWQQQQQYHPGWGYSYPVYHPPVGMPRYMPPQWVCNFASFRLYLRRV